MSGKGLRLKRLLPSSDGRTVIFPLDHGVSCGPIPGLECIGEAIRLGSRGGADALVLHKGMLSYLDSVEGRIPGILMHLSASTQLGNAFHRKILVGTVEEALRRGADGVSVHLNLGDEREPEMLRDLGMIGSECEKWQIPLLVMIYVRGTHAPSPVSDSAIAHATRVAAELGADIIKIAAPKDDAVLAKITQGSPVPVIVAGGSKAPDTLLFLERVERSLKMGARGVAVGRNVFQHARPEALLGAVRDIVHGGFSAAEANEKLSLEREIYENEAPVSLPTKA